MSRARWVAGLSMVGVAMLGCGGSPESQSGPLESIASVSDTRVDVCIPLAASATALAPGLEWGAPDWEEAPAREEFELLEVRFEADGVEVIDQLVLQNNAATNGPPSLGWPLESEGEFFRIVGEFLGKPLPAMVAFGPDIHYTVLLHVRLDSDGTERSWGKVNVTGLEYEVEGERYFRPAGATSFVGLVGERAGGQRADCGPEWVDPPQAEASA